MLHLCRWGCEAVSDHWQCRAEFGEVLDHATQAFDTTWANIVGSGHSKNSRNFSRVRFNTTSCDDVAHERKVCVFFDGLLGIKLNVFHFTRYLRCCKLWVWSLSASAMVFSLPGIKKLSAIANIPCSADKAAVIRFRKILLLTINPNGSLFQQYRPNG